MKHFICEFITAGGMRGQPLPESLKFEGQLMLQTLARELAHDNECKIISTRDDRLDEFEFNSNKIDEKDDVWRIWETCIDESDYFWPIAPETDGSLYRLTMLANEKHCRLIGSSFTAIQQCSSKHNMAEILAEHNIPAIPTTRLSNSIPGSEHGWVVKPDIGAGCEECYHIQERDQLQQFIQQYKEPDKTIIQPFMPGLPLSLTTLMYQGESVVLACNRQNIKSIDGQLSLTGLEVNAYADKRDMFLPIANKIAGLFSGLAGLVGLDIILNDKEFVIVEINPRMTTAFSGLSRSLAINTSRLIQELFINERLPAVPATAQTISLDFSKP